MVFDIAVIGGGPAGSTVGTLLKKYNPALSVLILEQECFPRDHIGESQLPTISAILDEMGVWDKVEAANFPIKIGSTNRWGKNPELWDIEFVHSEDFLDEPRPAKFEGLRRRTAFQVDRAIYDKILLDHTAMMGVDVREGTRVVKVHKTGDRVDGLEIESGEIFVAKHYVDASGHVGIIRRAMGVTTDAPTSLQNVAFWDYWQNAEWAVKIGVGGTKIQVMSLGYGWLWFIPLGPTRTSIGLVVPAKFYKESEKRPEELYIEAVNSDERIACLTKNATREHKFAATKDWSFLASRHFGENWYLIGESGGFADPILSAGMTMAHAAGRELAYTILEIERASTKSQWLKEQFAKRQSQRVVTHIRFADFWYAANAQFVDLKEHVRKLASDVGLDLTPEAAWRWIAQGGFVDEKLSIGMGGFNFNAVKSLGSVLSDIPTSSPFDDNNTFKLNLADSTWSDRAEYENGRVTSRQCYIRDGKVLPIHGPCETVVNLLQRVSDFQLIAKMLFQMLDKAFPDEARRKQEMTHILEAFEALINDGWIIASRDPSKPMLKYTYTDLSIRLNKDTLRGDQFEV